MILSCCNLQINAMISWVLPSAKTGMVTLPPSLRAAARDSAKRSSSFLRVNPSGNGAAPLVVSMRSTSTSSSGKFAPLRSV